jgi:hypothetical protein
MKLHHFLSASLEERAEFVWQQGNCVAIRSQEEFTIMLYHTGRFFAEVWYHSLEERLLMIVGFRDCQLLDAYLDEITLPALFEV